MIIRNFNCFFFSLSSLFSLRQTLERDANSLFIRRSCRYKLWRLLVKKFLGSLFVIFMFISLGSFRNFITRKYALFEILPVNGQVFLRSLSLSLSLSRVTNTVSKIHTKLYQLKISKNLLPDVLKINLITSLVFPHLDYCCAALTDITEELDLKLYRTIDSCIRFSKRSTLKEGWAFNSILRKVALA